MFFSVIAIVLSPKLNAQLALKNLSFHINKKRNQILKRLKKQTSNKTKIDNIYHQKKHRRRESNITQTRSKYKHNKDVRQDGSKNKNNNARKEDRHYKNARREDRHKNNASNINH